jgi:hypothetical protein
MEFLLIDDDLGYCQSLALFGKISGINITFKHNHKEGFAELGNGLKYQALILDAKCLVDDIETKPSVKALGIALEMLTDFEKQTERFLPFVVCTGFNDFEPFFEGSLEKRKAKLYYKGEQNHQIEMLAYLKTQVENSQNFQLEKQYADVFEIFEKGYLGQDVREKLLNILRNINRTDNAEISKTLSAIRAVKEEIIRNQPNPSQPNLISSLSSTIQRNASDYGSHPPRVKDITPTKYTVISLAHALLEMLLWFKSEKEKQA